MYELSSDYNRNLSTSSPQARQNLKKRKLCQTNITDSNIRASILNRSLLFEALTNCGHIQPEVVMLTNDSHNSPACAHANEIHGVYVNFDERYWQDEDYGTKRMLMHHEAAHIVRKHYNNIDNTSHQNQNEERDADRLAAIKGKCSQCAREFACYFLKRNSQTAYLSKVLKSHKHLTIEDIDAMRLKERTNLTKQMYQISKKRKVEHPLHLERSLRLHRISLALGDTLCQKHQSR